MSNDWTNKLRDRLADYEEPVMDDLWAGIEQSLAQQKTQPNHHAISTGQEGSSHETTSVAQEGSIHGQASARQVWIRRFSMAAAIAALAVGGTYVYLHPWNEDGQQEVTASLVHEYKAKEKASSERDVTQEQNPSISQVAEVGKPLINSLANSVDKAFQSHTSHMAGSQVSMLSAKHEEESAKHEEESVKHEENVLNTDENQAMETTSLASLDDTNEVSEKEANSAETRAGHVSRQYKYSEREPLLASAYEAPTINKKKTESSWSMQFYGENGFVIENGNNGNKPILASADQAVPPSFYGNSDVNYDFKGMEYADFLDSKLLKSFDEQLYHQEVKHHKPISVGMQVGFKVHPRLRLNTGLVYTYVSSEFTGSANDTRTVTKQTLHYIGIPLNLDYEVWGTKNFHAYVTAGGEGAVNVKNHTETDGVKTDSKKDRMQWSVNGSIGIQYDFVPQLGIYVEPGVKYYFDNGSAIENTFKDKKTNFNFQLGLRWNVGK